MCALGTYPLTPVHAYILNGWRLVYTSFGTKIFCCCYLFCFKIVLIGKTSSYQCNKLSSYVFGVIELFQIWFYFFHVWKIIFKIKHLYCFKQLQIFCLDLTAWEIKLQREITGMGNWNLNMLVSVCVCSRITDIFKCVYVSTLWTFSSINIYSS